MEAIGVVREKTNKTEQGLTLGSSTSVYELIFCYRNRMIFYYKRRVMAGVPTKLPCSIIPVGDDKIDEDLKGLDNPAKSAGNPGGAPM